MAKKDLQQEINEFLEVFDVRTLITFLECTIPLTELYDIEENADWVEDYVGKDQVSTIRMIRTVYLISKLAETSGGKLATVKARFGNLYKRLEKIHDEQAKKG
jgi:hypothetical protein